MNTTATAHRAWDKQWQTDSGRADWLTPEPGVLDAIAQVQALAGRPGELPRALDLGCGVGRHALAMAAAGLQTCALDGSPAGVEHLQKAAAKVGLSVDVRRGLMTNLPYPDGYFDYVLSFNVIYHGDEPVVRQAIAEIRRVLKPGGLYQGTMLSKRNAKFGQGREVAPNTFVIDGEEDKAHPHYYCDGATLIELFGGFELLSLIDREHSKPGSWHWHLLAERGRGV